MVERQIKLTAKEDVKEFVNEASKCARVLTVRCNGEDERFNNFLNKYAVA